MMLAGFQQLLVLCCSRQAAARAGSAAGCRVDVQPAGLYAVYRMVMV
jgi:hypothetical protein